MAYVNSNGMRPPRWDASPPAGEYGNGTGSRWNASPPAGSYSDSGTYIVERLSVGQKLGALGAGVAAGSLIGGAMGAAIATGKKNPKHDGFTRNDVSNVLWWTLGMGAVGGTTALINQPKVGLFVAAGGLAAGLAGSAAYGMLN